MKLFLCFVLLFVAVRAQYEPQPVDEEKQDPFWPDAGPDADDDDADSIYMIDEGPKDDGDDDDDDDDEDDDPTTPSPTEASDQCMRKYWECKKTINPYSCAGKLKCYEEKSECYKTRMANRPDKPTKSPAKMACKTKFEGCLANAGDKCMAKLTCYKEKKICYSNTMPWGRRRHHHRRPHHHRPRHHHRRRHHHHRRHRNPKAMKCKVTWVKCVMTARSCPDRLKCFWDAKKCMKNAWPKHHTTTEPPTTPHESDNDDDDDDDDDERRRRRWDPKVIAECKAEFKECINSTDDCKKKIGCFFRMKRCVMERHRPTPCPKMMKCKMEYKNCTAQLANNTCEDKLKCKLEMHECMESVRPTGTPPPTPDRPEYGRRRHWDPKRREKCVSILDKCLNESSSCQEKMKCFWKMKKCMWMPRGGPSMQHKMSPYYLKMKLKKMTAHVKGYIVGALQKARNWFQNKRQGMGRWGQGMGQGMKRWGQGMGHGMRKWGQGMRKRGQGMGHGMKKWGQGMGQGMRKWGQGMGQGMRKWGQGMGQRFNKKTKEMKRKWQQKKPWGRRPWSG